ncbi:MAG TPA: DUF3034 family protein [Rhizomicrobium sp.]|jgi:hypothetical protein
MRTTCHAAIAAVLLSAAPTFADDAPASSSSMMDVFDGGKLLATGGVSSLEGAGGGGLSTWALITGYGTRDGVGVDAHATYISLPDYSLWTEGVAIGLFDRVELSYTHLTFDTEKVGGALGLGDNFKFDQDIYGAKVKLFGDAVYDQDSFLPEVSVGAQYKTTNHADILHFVGAKSSSGTDYYIAATKLFLAQSLLVDVTVRETKANQFGILGFGGDKHGDYSTQFEGSAAYLFSRKFAVGAEYRTKPDNLGIAREDNAWDVFAAYFFNKNVSLTAAYLDLGNIVIKDHQHGAYLSLQVGM